MARVRTTPLKADRPQQRVKYRMNALKFVKFNNRDKKRVTFKTRCNPFKSKLCHAALNKYQVNTKLNRGEKKKYLGERY